MEWWTYLWLNEGFARFTEFTAVHFIFPEWNIWTQFVTDVHAQALVLDAMHSSHPVEVTVSHPDQINEIFDTISYAKGASLIRMLSDAIGAEVYFKGINVYLQRHAYGNTRSQDLWNALSEASSINVGELMDGWLKQVGYPVVSVAALENDPQTLTISQQPFYADMTESNTDKSTSKSWVIPISLTTLDANGAPIEFQRLTLKDKSTTLKIASKFAAVKVNNGHTGFFRTKYDTPALFTALSVAIPHLSSVDRLGLLKDTFALATSGLISISIALDLLRKYTHETDYDVVHAFTADLSMLATLHSDETYYSALQSFIRSLYTANYQRLGWADNTMTAATQADISDPRNGLFRSDVISMLSISGDESIIKKSIDYVKAAADSPATNSIPADLKAVVYATAAKHGGLDAQQLLLKIYGASSSSEERSRVLSTIGSSSGDSSDAELVIRANIDWGINSGDVRLADVPTLMSSIASSKRGRLFVWDYLKANWESVTGKFSTGQNFLIGSLLTGILSPHTDAAVADDIEKWFSVHPIASAERVVRQSLERIRNKANRLNRERADISAWLAKTNSV